MRILNIFILGVLFFAFTISISATNVNGRFVVMSTDSLKLKVLLQINTNTGSDDMGGATVLIGFNTYSLNFNSNPQVNTDYVFHNFSGGNYSTADITRPAIDKLWLNIDLPFNNSNNGTVVSGSDGWTDVATLFFDIINPSDTLKLNWLITSPYWGIYDANNTILWSPSTFQNLNYAVNDITSPEIVSASLLDSVNLEILFSEPVESSSALNISNYLISNGISVLSGFLSTNQNKVTLNTTYHTPGQQYTVTVSNVHDLAGNLISSQNNPFNYPNSILKLNVCHASALHWYLDYTPDKTIDGITGGESRWSGAITMPDTIDFCLNDIQILNKTKLSFYNWDGGRIYNYSILVSIDSISWNQIKTNIISQAQEWSIEEVDPIETKYIKIILLSSNQSVYAGIWEAEFWGHLKIPANNDDDEFTPLEFSLEQNYPNPFNPSTKISWQSPVGSHQTIKVYDVLGNEIVTLVDEFKPAGSYEVEFNSENLASGVYIYRLQTAEFTETKKMVLLR